MIFPHHAPIQKLLHLSVTVLFSVSLLSGLRLAFDNPYMNQTLLHSGLIPQGNMFLWHEISAYFWIAIVSYVLYKWYQAKRQQPKHYKRQNPIITVVCLLTLIQCASGLLLYINPIDGLNSLLLPLHYFLSFIMLTLVVVHIIEQLIKRSLAFVFTMFMPTRIGFKTLIAVGCIGLISGGLYYYQHYFFTPLQAKKIDLAVDIRIDGKFDETSWHDAPSVTVYTSQGNDYFAQTPIEIKMLHNGLSAYFAIRWPDPTPSFSHLPLQKTAQGWQVQHDGFAVDDERSYYEDKLAVMLSDDPGLAGGYSVHLGDKPLADKPKSRSGRGFHYTEDNSLRDIWHWKAVRVKRMSYLDDNHFGAPMADCRACPRYKGGYNTDPKDSGSFRANWQWFLPQQVTPLRLPSDQAQLEKVQQQASMSWFDTKPYVKSEDDLPIGTQLPSVLNYEGFEGDRAHVAAKGEWKDGYWQLELARNIVTDSDFDLPLQTATYLWFVPFDHAQSRHSYHLKPVKLIM